MPLEELLTRGRPAPIVRWGMPVLHRPARPVTSFGPDLWNLLCDMFATNRAADGAGLAAPQVGVDLAVFVYDCVDRLGLRRQGLVCNPRTTVDADAQDEVGLEGCLSLPGAYVPVARPVAAVCHGQDQFGDPITVRGTGTLARCLLHETDHLDGVVLEDRITRGLRRAISGDSTVRPRPTTPASGPPTADRRPARPRPGSGSAADPGLAGATTTQLSSLGIERSDVVARDRALRCRRSGSSAQMS